MKYSKLVFIILILICFSCKSTKVNNTSNLNILIPTTGNSWVINNTNLSSNVISKEGINNWQESSDIIRTFFYVNKPTIIPFAIIAKVESGTSEIKISYGDKSKHIKLSNTKMDTIYIDDFQIKSKGYHHIDLQGITKEGNTFSEVESIALAQETDNTDIKYIKHDFYFGRRGPSTHLVYQTPSNVGNIEWFYNEIEINEGEDVIGSYFMANGFGEGYFGIQVNSETERRILFSIWSPYKTDNPNDIPEEYKIKLLKKGKGVITGKFGNEGSGGQSYKVFNWKSNTRYKFLTRVKPNGDDSTNYTSYFYSPETEKWNLIASFKRPKTDTYLTRPYSFLENFIPNMGVVSRKGSFYNQWVYDTKGQWHEVTDAKFSADATARKDARLDYSGGIENNGFYLKNCGFTNHNTIIGAPLKRSELKQPPSIDFLSLD